MVERMGYSSHLTVHPAGLTTTRPADMERHQLERDPQDRVPRHKRCPVGTLFSDPNRAHFFRVVPPETTETTILPVSAAEDNDTVVDEDDEKDDEINKIYLRWIFDVLARVDDSRLHFEN